MHIGIPKEIKSNEHRVGLTPESVAELVRNGHSAVVETNAGRGIGCTDESYINAGAVIANNAADIFESADMIVKVKEPQAEERVMLRPNQILYTYLHLAPDPQQTQDLIDSKAVSIAYETVTDSSGGLPLLKPMSQVAGRLSIQAGAFALEKTHGGRGILLGGVPGVAPGKVVIIGGGVAGFNAAQMAVGLHADVTIVDRSSAVIEKLEQHFEGAAKVIYSSKATVERLISDVDLVVGAVLIPGAAAPKVVSREMLGMMQDGSVLVDIAIDQGGCFATSKATTHDQPTYVVDGIVHYCVANMPGAVARTSTYALNNVTLEYALAIADKGWKQALSDNTNLRQGLNVCNGHVTCQPVADNLGYDYVPAEELLGL